MAGTGDRTGGVVVYRNVKRCASASYRAVVAAETNGAGSPPAMVLSTIARTSSAPSDAFRTSHSPDRSPHLARCLADDPDVYGVKFLDWRGIVKQPVS
jgi:hypothetical protein